MPTDFNQPISRSSTFSLKYDGRNAHVGRQDVIPLWVADMDFAAPHAVQQALIKRAAHPIYGYTLYPESLYSTLVEWLAIRHGWHIEREWILFCPGVVSSLHATIMGLTQPDEAIIVQPPVYAPFLSAPGKTGRKAILNPLQFENGRYRFDLEHFEQCAASGARILLLCSPHNPVGRVWEAQELQPLLRLCQHYGITILSDEVHADLTYRGYKHTPIALLAQNAVNVITAVAPSKTFNIPGLGLSALIVPESNDRAAISQIFETWHLGGANPFSIAAFEAAYREGKPWLDELLSYLADTREAVRTFLQRIPDIELIEPEGTFLLWLDCRKLQLNDSQLKCFFVEKAGVELNSGISFGAEGSGFMRMNIAAPRSLIMQALERVAQAATARNRASLTATRLHPASA